MANPYAAPKADLTTKVTGGSIDNIPTLSTFIVVLLTIFTLGIYSMFWIYNRSKLLNEASTGQKVSMPIIIGFIVLAIVANVASVLAGDPPSIAMAAVSGLTALAYLVLFFVWAFSFRKIFHNVLKIEKGNPLWCNAFLVVLLNVFYFNYKINQVKETR